MDGSAVDSGSARSPSKTPERADQLLDAARTHRAHPERGSRGGREGPLHHSQGIASDCSRPAPSG